MKNHKTLVSILSAAILTVAAYASDSTETKPLILSANQGDLENSRYVITGYAEITVYVGETGSIEPVEVLSATDSRFEELARSILDNREWEIPESAENLNQASQMTAYLQMHRKLSLMERYSDVYTASGTHQKSRSWGVSYQKELPNYPELRYAPNPAPASR